MVQMIRNDHTGPDAHRKCWDLLPWAANGSASADELAQIEAHLPECRQCRQELQFQRQVRDAIRSDKSVVLAPQTSLQKLMQRIDGMGEAAATRESLAVTTTHCPAQPRSGWSRWLPVAAAIQGVAIAALLAAMWLQSRESLIAPRFTTLTSQTAVARGPVIRAVFASGTSIEAINAVLRGIDAQIVAGPSEAGVYTLGLALDDTRALSVAEVLARLRADARVVFAEAALAQAETP